MINSVNVPVQTVTAQSNVLFSTDRVRSRRCSSCCGGWLQHDAGSGQFTLINNNSCGSSVFEISFNCDLTSATTGAIALAIQANGEAIGGTEMDYTVATESVYQSVGANTLIKVPANTSVTITVKNTSTTTSVQCQSANIIIKKIA